MNDEEDKPFNERGIKHYNKTNFDRVRDFFVKFGQVVGDKPDLGSPELQLLRHRLIAEEFFEYQTAVADGNINDVADALTDLLYVVYGAGVAYGIDLDACFAEVHRSNMSKLGEDGMPIYNDYGKVIKGPNYSPPNLTRFVR